MLDPQADAVNVEQKIERLQANVRAAIDEFDLVVKLYETWHPTAYDRALFKRMGESFASNAFHVIREALQREIVIGLTKLWDTGDRAIRMDKVGAYIRSQAVVHALAIKRAASFPFPGVEAMIQRDLGAKAEAALVIIDKYSPNSPHRSVHNGLHKLRNMRFAHRQITADAFSEITLTTDEVHTFYQDMSALMRLLTTLVLAVAHDPQEFALVYRSYAAQFWAAARGEQTEGHPNYRAPPPLPPGMPQPRLLGYLDSPKVEEGSLLEGVPDMRLQDPPP